MFLSVPAIIYVRTPWTYSSKVLQRALGKGSNGQSAAQYTLGITFDAHDAGRTTLPEGLII